MAYSDIEMFAVDSLLIEEEYRRIDAQYKKLKKIISD